MKTELWVKEVGEFYIMLYQKMDRWTFFCPPAWLLQYKCILLNSEQLQLLHLFVHQLETCRDTSNWGPLRFVGKVANLNF